MKHSSATLFFLVLIVVLGIPLTARADFTFAPSLMVREEYNDNIYLTDDNKEEDFITTIRPGLKLGYLNSALDLSLDYALSFYLYANNSGDNETTHTVNASAMITPIRDVLFINITDVYQRVTIDQRKPTGTDNYLTNQTDTNRFVINPYLELPRSGSLKVRLGASYEDLWYREDDGDDAKKYTALASVTKNFAERYSVKLAYSYLVNRPTINAEYDRQDASVTFIKKNESGLSFEGTAGVADFNYTEREYSDTSAFVWNVRLRHASGSGRFSIDAGYAEDFSDSVDQGALFRKSADINVRYEKSVTLTVGGFWANEDYEQIDREDRSHGAKVGMSLPLSSHFTARTSGIYTRYKFLPDEEETDRYTAQASIEYLLRNVIFTIGYTFNLNDSNFDSNDYTNNIAFIQARLTF
jgi:hypothetical protein